MAPKNIFKIDNKMDGKWKQYGFLYNVIDIEIAQTVDCRFKRQTSNKAN